MDRARNNHQRPFVEKNQDGSSPQVWALHDSRITSLSQRMTTVESQLSGMDTKLDNLTNTLHDMRSDLVAQAAQARAKAPMSIKDAVSTLLHVAVLFSLIVGGIIYVASGANANGNCETKVKTAVLEYRLDQAEKAPRVTYVPKTVQ